MQPDSHIRPRVLIWSRVPTDRQETANQVLLLRDWAERRGWAVVRVLEVTESAFQGKHLAALTTVYQGAARREFDIMAVFGLDRLSRQGVGATFEIIDRLARLGVAVASYSEPWLETGDSAMRELLLALSGWIARQESVR